MSDVFKLCVGHFHIALDIFGEIIMKMYHGFRNKK